MTKARGSPLPVTAVCASRQRSRRGQRRGRDLSFQTPPVTTVRPPPPTLAGEAAGRTSGSSAPRPPPFGKTTGGDARHSFRPRDVVHVRTGVGQRASGRVSAHAAKGSETPSAPTGAGKRASGRAIRPSPFIGEIIKLYLSR